MTVAVNNAMTNIADKTCTMQETMKEELGTIRQELSVCRTIGDSQSAIAMQQTIMTETVEDTMRRVADHTQTTQDAVQAAISRFAALDNQTADKLDVVLELLSRLSAGHSRGAEAVGLNDDAPSVDETGREESILHAELANSIKLVLDTIRGKQGFFLLEQASDITKALFTFLEAAVREPSLQGTPLFMSRYQGWCETCTEGDLAELRRDLMAVRGVLMSSRNAAVNEPGKPQHEIYKSNAY